MGALLQKQLVRFRKLMSVRRKDDYVSVAKSKDIRQELKMSLSDEQYPREYFQSRQSLGKVFTKP